MECFIKERKNIEIEMKKSINDYVHNSIKELSKNYCKKETTSKLTTNYFKSMKKQNLEISNIIFEICNLEHNKIESTDNKIKKAISYLKIAIIGEVFEYNNKYTKENAQKAYDLIIKKEQSENLEIEKYLDLKKQLCSFAKNIVEKFKLEKIQIETIKDEFYFLNTKLNYSEKNKKNILLLRKI